MAYNETNTKKTYNFNQIFESIKRNYIFYIVFIVCMVYLSTYTKASIFKTIFSFIAISFIGYLSHIISHFVEHFNILHRIDTKLNNIVTEPGNLVTYIISKILKFYCFHDNIHHDTTINKQSTNIVLEFIGNLWFQGGLILACKYMLNYMDNSTIIVWSLLYATVHNINYVIYPSQVHIKHHLDKFTNYGIDIWDIIFNTKSIGDEPEYINHYAINCIICTLIVCLWWLWWRTRTKSKEI